MAAFTIYHRLTSIGWAPHAMRDQGQTAQTSAPASTSPVAGGYRLTCTAAG